MPLNGLVHACWKSANVSWRQLSSDFEKVSAGSCGVARQPSAIVFEWRGQKADVGGPPRDQAFNRRLGKTEMPWVYVLENPSMPRFVKIGYTDRTIEERIEELSRGTGVPEPFTLLYGCEVRDAAHLERLLHTEFKHERVRTQREFFKARPFQVLIALKSILQRERIRPQSLRGFSLDPENKAEPLKATGQTKNPQRPQKLPSSDPYEGKKGRLGLRIEHAQDLHRYLQRNNQR
jgi:hypothetical protein